MGGTWMMWVYGFAGMRDFDGELSFHPLRPPAQQSSIRFELTWHGQRLKVAVGVEATSYSLVEGEGIVIRLPLGPVIESGAWGHVLAHVVPALADEMWAQIEDGEQVELAPGLDPATGPLAWWAWLPALGACLAASGVAGAGVVLALVVFERGAALLRARVRAVALHRAGAGFRFRLWRFLVAWPRIDVLRVPGGLVLGVHGRTCNLTASGLPNFWAAAPVIEMKAHLGPRTGATVHFRVRLAEDGPAVVGEVEPG